MHTRTSSSTLEGDSTVRFMILVKATKDSYEIEDFGPSEAMERFREIGIGTGKR